MEDRELLELAEKAAEMTLYAGDSWRNTASGVGLLLANGRQVWNPIYNDGEALRLAVNLGLQIQHHDDNSVVVWDDYIGTGFIPYAGDAYAATRRAIVLAAAAIGEELKKNS